MYISLFDHKIWYTNTAKSSTEKLISTVLDFDMKGNSAVLQPWTKIVETKVESLLNSRNESIFQILNYPPDAPVSILNQAKVSSQIPKTLQTT